MKLLLKSALVGATLVASTAFADVAPPNTGNGELVLFVRDVNAPGRVYARGLGVTIDSVLNPSVTSSADPTFDPTTGVVKDFTYSLPASIGPDGNLTSFLGGGAAGTTYVWTVLAADTLDNSFIQDTGEYRFLSTSPLALKTNPGSVPTNNTIEGVWTNIDGMTQDLNNVLPNASGSSTASDGQWGQSGTVWDGGGTWFGGGLVNENSLGSAANLYLVSNSSDNSLHVARAYQSTIQLRLTADGTLENVGSVVTPPQVPLPAAVWLLGSALVGVAGIRRRRPEQAA